MQIVAFSLPMGRNRQGEWKIPADSMVMTRFSSDFFIEEMDATARYVVKKRPRQALLNLANKLVKEE
ncbi:hypothetical protein JJE63_01710 [Alloprevotella tannerae]|uniref:hypothetical protein n=1 Tax=Alloprevotella tannerae TaxID=76122 RepID=UPI001EDB2298|nr:hypothetical protein [Alloprevotella tannerae]MCG2652050.1 hypothetical protein [Alloprevotella tannerae]